MVRTFKNSIRSAFILLTVISAGSLYALQSELVTINKTAAEDIYLAGASVQIAADVPGDAVVTGGSINVSSSVTEDLLAAGGTVNIIADVGDDIRAAGGSVAIIGNVGDDLVAAGGTVVLDSASTVSGNAWLAGGAVTVAGKVAGELRAAGENIILAGTIDGDVELRAESIEIKPGTVIKGNLHYSAPGEAKIHKSAVIAGNVSRNTIEGFDDNGAGFIGKLMFYLSLAACSIALILLAPQLPSSVVRQLRETPFKASGLGLVVLFSSPFIALMLLVSVIGVPIGLVVLALYVVALIIGLLIGVIWIGDTGFRQIGKEPDESKRTRIWSIVTGAVALLIVTWVPFVGGWVFFIVLLLGVGGFARYLYQSYANRCTSHEAISKPADQSGQ